MKKRLLCKIGIYDEYFENAHGQEGIVGRVKICCKCGKISSWGNVIIPKYYYKVQKEIRAKQ